MLFVMIMRAFRYYRRKNGFYYCQDTSTGKQASIGTKDEGRAREHVDALNRGAEAPTLAKKQALAVLSVTDPRMHSRRWSEVMEAVTDTPNDNTRTRREREFRSKIYDLIRDLPIIDTNPEVFRKILSTGRSSPHVYLKLLQNYAVDAGWLDQPVVPKRQWPKKKRAREKRAITRSEHWRILRGERNTERRLFYAFLWETGASQSDAANMNADRIDWRRNVLAFNRCKTGEVCKIGIGTSLKKLLKRLPDKGPLFPKIANSSANHRASEFSRRCRCSGITGVSLHSYRYSWAQRAFEAGYPERWARHCLGHGSSVVHQIYSKKLDFRMVPLDEYSCKE